MPDESSRIRRWIRAIRKFIRQALSRPPTSQTESLPSPPTPRGHAVVLRGLVSTQGDKTFKELESRLTAANIGVKRFSYKGPLDPYYEPLDTITDMRRLANYLEKYVCESAGDVPLYLIGHSLGGLIIANWICRSDGPPDHLELVSKVDKVFFLAAPLFPPSPTVPIQDLVPGIDEEVEYSLIPYGYDVTELLDRFPGVVVLRCEKDLIAPEEYASLIVEGAPNTPLDEVEIPAGHLDICNHEKAVEIVMSWVSQDS